MIRPERSKFGITLLIAGCLTTVLLWIISTWVVFGITIGPYSLAAGPGGWELCRWETVTAGSSFQAFTYSVQSEDGTAAGLQRVWGLFIYHWLVLAVCIAFSSAVAWLFLRNSNTIREAPHQ